MASVIRLLANYINETKFNFDDRIVVVSEPDWEGRGYGFQSR